MTTKSPTMTTPPPLSQRPRSTSISIAGAPRRLSVPVELDPSGRRHSTVATTVPGSMVIQAIRNMIGDVTAVGDGRRLSRKELPFYQQIHDPQSWTHWVVQQSPGHRMLMRASPLSYAEATEGKMEKTVSQKVSLESAAVAQLPAQQEKGGTENPPRSQRRFILSTAASAIPAPRPMPTTGRRESSDERAAPPPPPPPPPAAELRQYSPRKSYHPHHRSGGHHEGSGSDGGGGIIASPLSPVLKAREKRDSEKVLRGRNAVKSVAKNAGRRGAQLRQQSNGLDQLPEVICLRQLDRFLYTKMLRHTQSEMAVILSSSSPQFY